jgi:CRP-like cAMP-binding protein
MKAPVNANDTSDNRLLATLSDKVSKDLLAHSTMVNLTKGQTLYDSHSQVTHCYFLERSLMSLMSYMEDGASVAVGMVGDEGVIGAAALLDEHLLPYRSVAQTSGRALRIPVAILREWLSHDVVLRGRIVCFAHAMFTQVVQTAACNRFHVTEQRLARWLLLARDRLELDSLPFTHESLSHVIGTDRASITRAIQSLKRQGLINYTRGRTTILDPQMLASESCECYRVVKIEYDALMDLCSTSPA